jgi:hypothetical protein
MQLLSCPLKKRVQGFFSARLRGRHSQKNMREKPKIYDTRQTVIREFQKKTKCTYKPLGSLSPLTSSLNYTTFVFSLCFATYYIQLNHMGMYEHKIMLKMRNNSKTCNNPHYSISRTCFANKGRTPRSNGLTG